MAEKQPGPGKKMYDLIIELFGWIGGKKRKGRDVLEAQASPYRPILEREGKEL